MADLPREEWPEAKGNQSLTARARAGLPAAPAQIAQKGKGRPLMPTPANGWLGKAATARPAVMQVAAPRRTAPESVELLDFPVGAAGHPAGPSLARLRSNGRAAQPGCTILPRRARATDPARRLVTRMGRDAHARLGWKPLCRLELEPGPACRDAP